MSIVVIYDNTIQPNEIIQEVIGQKGFGDVVVKRRRLKEYYGEGLGQIFQSVVWREFEDPYDIERSLQEGLGHGPGADVRVLHCFADHILSDRDAAALTFKKIDYIKEDICLMAGERCAAVMFHDIGAYTAFLKRAVELRSTREAIRGISPCLGILGLSYIGEIGGFIQCVAGNFESRYFNSLVGTEYRLRKSSTDKRKIESEYRYYHLLPDHMKVWFVMPFDYQEEGATASYAMERLHMTDLAIKWVHGSIGMEEFGQILDMYLYFFRERSRRGITKEVYRENNETLYVRKVRQRLDMLEALPEYGKIACFMAADDRLGTVDAIFDRYMGLKERVEERVDCPCISVIGHGDPCFANTMYDHPTRTMKFIDPKGALTEEDLWTDPYYDIAKLSHSICGDYDFFNNAMFDITVDEQFRYHLSIPFDNTEYKEVFRQKLEGDGYDYQLVRIYEASLFLSMLPLHIDRPHKVFGLLLNAVGILEEIERDV